MQIDFAAMLVIAGAVTGLIYLLDVFVFAPRRARAFAGDGRSEAAAGEVEIPLPWYIDFSRSFFPVIIAVLILRSFIVEPFRIPSSSMEPTLFPRDFILVNKFIYGLRLPVTHDKIMDWGEPERGDVIVFRYPEDRSVAYIKRLVGLPGDTLDYRDKQLYLNGEPVPQIADDARSRALSADIRKETFGDNEHYIQVNPHPWRSSDADRKRGEWPKIVPEGHYFMMGDNRDNSRDSRSWGFLPESHLIGKAFFIWMNWDCVTFNGNCNRIGSSIE